jgi:hypothetical protein
VCDDCMPRAHLRSDHASRMPSSVAQCTCACFICIMSRVNACDAFNQARDAITRAFDQARDERLPMAPHMGY